MAILLSTLPLASMAEEPDADFLEFLGMMVEHEGKFIDALEMISIEPDSLPMPTESTSREDQDTDTGEVSDEP